MADSGEGTQAGLVVDPSGRHILAEFSGCDEKILNDSRAVVRSLHAAVSAANATVVGDLVYPFKPQGVSAVVLVAESHFSIHTWPEYAFASADIYTCGDCYPERGMVELGRWLHAKKMDVLEIQRGKGVDFEVKRLSF